MKKIVSLILALIMCLSLCVPAFATNGEIGDGTTDTTDPGVTWDFTGADEDLNQLDDEILPLVTKFFDVKTTAWYYNDVTECAKLGIVQGFENGTFKPEDKVTGIQFVVMLTRTFYNSKVEAAKKTETSSWYAPNMKVANDIGMLQSNAVVNDKAMDRYEMANVLYQVLKKEGKTQSITSTGDTQSKIKDYNSIPSNRRTQVKICYYLGIITGMTDGTFSGASSMTRAQACTVIMRMLKLINNYNPGDKDNDQYDNGKDQDTGNNNTGGNGTLANGKPATEANVTTMLNELHKKYPDGTAWGWNTKYSPSQAVLNARSCINTNLSMYTACGAFAAMISDSIFGNNTGSEVTDITKVRPGDIMVQTDKNGKPIHGNVVINTIAPGKPGNANTDRWVVLTYDGNVSNEQVAWGCHWGIFGCGKNNANPYTGEYFRFITRY